jgi:TRAP transporter TAXI family solute receptor
MIAKVQDEIDQKEGLKMGKKSLKMGFICLAVILVVSGTAFAQERQFKFGGGTSGGPWFVGVGAGVAMLNQNAQGKFIFTYGASAGSVENTRRVSTYEYDTGFAHVLTLYEALNGLGQFKGRPPAKNLRAIAKVMDLTHLWVSLQSSNIKTMSDLAGKKVNIGPPGSGTQVNSMYILQALGIYEKIKAQHLTFAGGARALSDRQIEVTTGAGIPYTVPAITEIAQMNPVRYIPVSEQEYKKIHAKYPFYQYITIPKGVCKGVDAPVQAIAYSAYWIVNDRMPDDVIYDMLKIVMEPKNNKILAQIQKNWSAVSGDLSGVAGLGIPCKKGAAKFWQEKGVKLPEGMKVE